MGEPSNAMGRVRYCPKGHAFADDKLICCPECGLPFSDTKKADEERPEEVVEKDVMEINHNSISGVTWLGLVFVSIVYGVLAIYDGALFWHQTLVSVGLPQLTNLNINLKFFSTNEAIFGLAPLLIAFLACISYKKDRNGFSVFMAIIYVAISLLTFAGTLSFDNNNLICVCLSLYVLSCIFIIISMFSPASGKMCAIFCVLFFVLSALLTAYLSLHVCTSGLLKPIKLAFVGIKNYQSRGLDYTLLDGSRLLHNARTSFSGAFLFPPSRCIIIFINFYLIQTIRKKAS